MFSRVSFPDRGATRSPASKPNNAPRKKPSFVILTSLTHSVSFRPTLLGPSRADTLQLLMLLKQYSCHAGRRPAASALTEGRASPPRNRTAAARRAGRNSGRPRIEAPAMFPAGIRYRETGPSGTVYFPEGLH